MSQTEKKLVTLKSKQFAITVLAAIVLLACRSGTLTSQTRNSPSPPPKSSPQPSPAPESAPQINAADAGKGLRRMALTTPVKEMDIKPSAEFPRVYGILMDLPIGKDTATVFSVADGTASVYTTSTFGILGGYSATIEAKKFVKAADRFYEAATPTTEYPYPAADRVRFYLLTFNGVRVIDTDLASIENGTSKYTGLFGLGQEVLTELRKVYEKNQ